MKQEFHRGRLIDHVHLVVADLERSKRFYQAVLKVLNVPIQEGPSFFVADELFVSPAPTPDAKTGRVHLAFQAKDQETVKRFYAAGVEAGGRDNGAPGERKYHPGYYAAFLHDPDGNNVEAVFHGPFERSADAVKITAK